MYPFPVVLLGINEGFLPALRRELNNGTAAVECEFGSASTAIECLRHRKNEPRLLIVQIGLDCQAETIRRLGDGLSGWPILALVADGTREDFLRINRAGAVQVVPLPIDKDDFHQALNLIAAQFGKGALDRHVIAVTGAGRGERRDDHRREPGL